MIIVSQNKESIYNFNNMKSITVIRNEVFIEDDVLSGEGPIIGLYETEERAKEVLQEIVKHYYNYELTKVYEMPEE